MMLVGIISYLPKDLDKRKIRFEEHQRQLANVMRVLPDCPIIIVQQNYEEWEREAISELLGKDRQCFFYAFEDGIGCAAARDVILKNFYNQPEVDHLLLMDDDVWIYPHYRAEDVLVQVHEHPEDFEKIDAFRAQHPRYLPFKERVFSDKRNLKEWKFTRRPPNTGMQFTVFRNVKKFKGKEVYHTEAMNSCFSEGDVDFTKYGLEDVDFHLKWAKAGLNYFDLETMQMQEPNQITSTIFSNDVQKRIEEEKQALATFVKMNPDLGLVGKDGKMQWKKVFGYFDKTADCYYVPRREPLECFPEDMIPEKLKGKINSRRKLW